MRKNTYTRGVLRDNVHITHYIYIYMFMHYVTKFRLLLYFQEINNQAQTEREALTRSRQVQVNS